jgi:hypothetical protein
MLHVPDVILQTIIAVFQLRFNVLSVSYL